MPDFQLKVEKLLNMCETVNLYQEVDSNHYNVPHRGNYNNYSNDNSLYIERSIDKLFQKEGTNDGFPPGAIMVTSDDESSHTERPDSKQI